MESDAGVASSTDILNLTNEIERLSKAEAEKMLQSLVKDKWLVEVSICLQKLEFGNIERAQITVPRVTPAQLGKLGAPNL